MSVVLMKSSSCSTPRVVSAQTHIPPVSTIARSYNDVGKSTSLPNLSHLVVEAKARYLSNFEISSAFNWYKLHWSLVRLLACKVEDYFVLPLWLVGLPAYCDITSKAVDWGISRKHSCYFMIALKFCQMTLFS